MAQGPALLQMDEQGREHELYRLTGELAAGGNWLHEPRPPRPRPREPVIPSRINPGDHCLKCHDVDKSGGLYGINALIDHPAKAHLPNRS